MPIIAEYGVDRESALRELTAVIAHLGFTLVSVESAVGLVTFIEPKQEIRLSALIENSGEGRSRLIVSGTKNQSSLLLTGLINRGAMFGAAVASIGAVERIARQIVSSLDDAIGLENRIRPEAPQTDGHAEQKPNPDIGPNSADSEDPKKLPRPDLESYLKQRLRDNPRLMWIGAAALVAIVVAWMLWPSPLDITCGEIVGNLLHKGKDAYQAVWDNLPDKLKTEDERQEIPYAVGGICGVYGRDATMREVLAEIIRQAQPPPPDASDKQSESDASEQPSGSVASDQQPQSDANAQQTAGHLVAKLHRAGARIDSSLYLAAMETGVPVEVLIQMIHMFSHAIDLDHHGLSSGDSFEVLYTYYYTRDGKPAKQGDIEYARIKLKNLDISLYRFQPNPDQPAGYFDSNGRNANGRMLGNRDLLKFRGELSRIDALAASTKLETKVNETANDLTKAKG